MKEGTGLQCYIGETGASWSKNQCFPNSENTIHLWVNLSLVMFNHFYT